MADRYYRLFTLVIDVCTPVLRQLFLTFAKADTLTPFIDIKQYMSAKKPIIHGLRCIPKHIYEKIYNSGPIDEGKWDITATTCLLLGIFSLPPQVKASVEQIGAERNKLQYITQLRSLTEKEFENTWRSIEQSINQLVSNLSPGFQQQTTENINEARIGNLPNICNTLTTWCLGMAGDLEEIKENTKVTRHIVEDVTETQVNSQGKVVKRFKAVNDILRCMKECFDSTMSRELLDDFEPPDCSAQIRDYLRQKRHVIVTGTIGRSYLQVALAAIKDVNNHGPNVSAEINFPSDWRHIDQSEIKFILCTNPFGDHDFDTQKARAMLDVLYQIMNSAYAGELTLAIVTKKDVLVQAQKEFGKDHDVLQNIVEPYAETTEKNPEIIDDRSTTSCFTNCQRMHSALQERSSCYLSQIEELPLRKSVFEEAKSTMKKERVVVLVGRNERLILSCIKQLAEQFAPDNCLVMSNPDDFQHLDAEAAMVVCLHITGQFAFDRDKSRRWFENFDLIHALVKSNKLRVVLMFEQSKLKRCIQLFTNHDLLRHTVKIKDQDDEKSRVKKEATDEDELPSPDLNPQFDVTKTSYLTTQKQLNKKCVKFGRRSDVVLSDCEDICKQLKGDIEAALQKKDFVADIYPAYCIESVSEIVFVVTLKEEVDTSSLKHHLNYRTEIKFLGKSSFEFIYCTNAPQLHENVSIDNQTKVKRCLSDISQKLLTRHKYLSVITASSVKSRCFDKKEKKSDITQQLCIVLCVHAKGFIPIDEDEFPDNYNGIPTDVMEGSFKSYCKTANEKHANVRMGCEIQRKGTKVTGTLGGFIEHPEYGMCGIISAHVALHLDELSECKYRGGHLKLNHWPERYVNDRAIYQPAAYDDSQPIGQLVEAVYIEGDNGTSGVDIAIFKITDRLPVDGTFPAQIRGEATTLKFTSGMTTGSINTSNHTLWKFGKTSGQTRGQMEFVTPFVSVKEIHLRFMAGDFQVVQYNLHEVTSTDDNHFACPGDSGALVFLEKEDLVCVGVIEGGFEGGGPVFVSPINPILKQCNVTQLKSFYPTHGEMAASISEMQKQITKHERTMETNFSEILHKLAEIQQ
ncbi:hypothetical protein MAR_032861, partial [Mya arenaria]